MGPLPIIVLMYFTFKIPVSMLSLCAMAVVSKMQHHQEHLHYLRPVEKAEKESNSSNLVIQCCCLGKLLHLP